MALFALLVYAALAIATPVKRATAFFNPTDGGGSLLDVAGVGVGEPMNVHATCMHYPNCIADRKHRRLLFLV